MEFFIGSFVLNRLFTTLELMFFETSFWKSYLRFVLCMMSAVAFLTSCSDGKDEKRRDIRAHDVFYDGVGHPIASSRAEHYCKECHGEQLSGGKDLIPSCYQCHGKNWSDTDPDQGAAPADHTVLNGSFLHHPSLKSPAGTCDGCHGSDLKGDSVAKRPSCYLCHDLDSKL